MCNDRNLGDMDAGEVDALFARAVDFIKNRDLSSAEKLLLRFVAELPGYDHGLVWYELADIYEETGRIEASQSAYENALSYEPDSTVYLEALATFFWRQTNARDARPYFTLARDVFAARRDEQSSQRFDRILSMIDAGRDYSDYEREVGEQWFK